MRARTANSLRSGEGRQIETRREGSRRHCVTRSPIQLEHDFSRQPGTMIEATLSAALLASALLPGSSNPAASDLDALFPPATKAMVVTSGPESEKFTYYDLVRQYAQATDQEVSMTEATKGLLRSRSVDLSQVLRARGAGPAHLRDAAGQRRIRAVPAQGRRGAHHRHLEQVRAGAQRAARRHDLPRGRSGRPGGEAPRGSLHRDDRSAEHRHPTAVELASNPHRGFEHPADRSCRNLDLDGARRAR